MKEIEVYSFDELSDTARAKACQQIGDTMTENAWWYEDAFDLFMEVDVKDIYFTDFLEQEYAYFYSTEYADEIAYDNNMLFLANGLVYSWGE